MATSSPSPASSIVLVHVVTDAISLVFLRGQLAYFRSRGLQPHAVSSPGREQDRFSDEEGVPVHGVPLQRAISPVADLVGLVLLVRLFRRLRPAVAHCGTPKAGLLGMLAAVLARVPCRIYHVRGLRYTGTRGPLEVVLRATEWLACRCAHLVVCDSASVRSVLVEDGVCPAGKTRLIAHGSCNGVDAFGQYDPRGQDVDGIDGLRKRLGVTADIPIVGFVGRLARDKGVAELARAWAVLRQRHAIAHLIVVGPNEVDSDDVATHLESLRRDARVHFAGHVDDPAPWYALMHVCCLPSYREGFPMVPLEAASMEVPMVVTRVTGCIDAVEDGITGTIVPVRDPSALANATLRYLSDADLRRAHGRAGRARAIRLFRRELVWEGWLELYASAIDPVSDRAQEPA